MIKESEHDRLDKLVKEWIEQGNTPQVIIASDSNLEQFVNIYSDDADSYLLDQ